MSQLTCIACQRQIFKGQRAISLEFGHVEQSQKSQRDIIKGYALDTIHFECIQDYLGRIDGELYSSIMEHHKKVIRREVIDELRDELKQEAYDEVYDEVVDELGKTCSTCRAELDEQTDDNDGLDEISSSEAMDPIIKSAVVQGPSLPTIPPWPPNQVALPPSPFPIPQVPASK